MTKGQAFFTAFLILCLLTSGEKDQLSGVLWTVWFIAWFGWLLGVWLQ